MNTQDTYDICKLSLHSRTHFDTIIWNASPNGSYTVKYAYKMCLSISDQRSLSCLKGVEVDMVIVRFAKYQTFLLEIAS